MGDNIRWKQIKNWSYRMISIVQEKSPRNTLRSLNSGHKCMMGLEVSWLLSLWFTAFPPNFLQ